MIIGITGSIGSGKTTAAKIFGKYHFNRIDADEIGHSLLKSDSKIKNRIIEEFGKEILGNKNSIDRKKLGNIVFNDKSKLKKLNSIMHRPIISKIKNQIKNIQKKCGADAKIVIDAPLLIETNLKNLVDKVAVVKCDEKIQIERILKKGKHTKKEINQIIKSQIPLKNKLNHADFVVDNGRDAKNLESQIKDIIEKTENHNSLS